MDESFGGITFRFIGEKTILSQMRNFIRESNMDVDKFLVEFVYPESSCFRVNIFRNDDDKYYFHTKPDGWCCYKIVYQVNQMFISDSFEITKDNDLKPSDPRFIAFLGPDISAERLSQANNNLGLPKNLWGDSPDLNDQTCLYSPIPGTKIEGRFFINLEFSSSHMRSKVGHRSHAIVLRKLSECKVNVAFNGSHYYFLSPIAEQVELFQKCVQRAATQFLQLISRLE